MDKASELTKYDLFIQQNLTSRSFQDEAHNGYEFMLLFNEKITSLAN